jgi:hypothetical protein
MRLEDSGWVRDRFERGKMAFALAVGTWHMQRTFSQRKGAAIIMVVIPGKATPVRHIFELCASGKGLKAIR